MNWLFRIFFMIFAGGILVLLFLFALLGLSVGLLRWLITGQKPNMAVAFSRVRQWRQQPFRRQSFDSRNSEVVDAEVREFRPSQRHKHQKIDKR
jgi:hypothetical protein